MTDYFLPSQPPRAKRLWPCWSVLAPSPPRQGIGPVRPRRSEPLLLLPRQSAFGRIAAFCLATSRRSHGRTLYLVTGCEAIRIFDGPSREGSARRNLDKSTFPDQSANLRR